MTGGVGYGGNGQQALSAQLANPKSLSFDVDDNLFFADRYNPSGLLATLPQSVRVIFSGKVHIPSRGNYGYMLQVAGTGTFGSTGDDGPSTLAKFNQVSSVAVDSYGNIYTRWYINYTPSRLMHPFQSFSPALFHTSSYPSVIII